MKNVIRIICIMLISVSISNQLAGQEKYRAMPVPPEPLLGTWIAEDGNKSYEMTLIQETLYFPETDHYTEYILGKLIYRENGKIVRETEYDRLNSIIYGRIREPNKVYFMFQDSERMVRWRFEFIIDENDPSKAVWKWGLGQGLMGSGWNKENEPDIPDNLTFRKVK